MTTSCRFCGAPLRHALVDLGRQPPSNSYVDDPAAAEKTYPLRAMICGQCFLAQLDEVVPADEIFSSDYAYFSSYSSSWVAHAKAYQEAVTARFALGPGSKVVEVASNDGYLLQHFLKAGIGVLGVEPSLSVANAAAHKGIPTEVLFFGAATAAQLRREGHGADIIAANNVLAHVPDITDFVRGLATLLNDDGVVTVEFPHLLNLIAQVQFDTIYHEHYSYLSLMSVERVFAAAGLRVFDVEALPTHGGSLRIYACHEGAVHRPCPGLAEMRRREAEAGLDDLATYTDFDARVRAVRDGLKAFLAEAHARGKTVAAYGAAAKGNTLLNYCAVGPDDIAFVVDLNPAKQGRFLPGSKIPIAAPEKLSAARPDYVLILPWNLRGEITEQIAFIRDWGGRFVVAIPDIEVF
ncbi:class I SAM-dependent methyltransferase [Varunaivibrio sulfuroxidans]|uniref:Methyltransferase family protein n=1 Tax=Varunaivibrio sulfuroxidans TaxID=1773489 RepID=A0A4R3JJE4_9PROT|nr:class I SAM-dependent methyltransferase [Varunaivibrio sulfuroxidans]TCS64990.1 methyltransferase family protein [Varunaivibrio sulfuroxidans]WES29720.1 class I SAM-dependent methyltransferase [Varunaivibrio sulfuroxidans]